MTMQDMNTGKDEAMGGPSAEPSAHGRSGNGRNRTEESEHRGRRIKGSLTREIRERGRTLLYEQKQRTADELGDLADGLRETSERFKEQKHAMCAHYMDRIADQVQRASSYIKEEDMADVLERVEDWIRREPLLFFGGAFGVGFLLARFLKDSDWLKQTGDVHQGRYGAQPPETPESKRPSPADESISYTAH